MTVRVLFHEKTLPFAIRPARTLVPADMSLSLSTIVRMRIGARCACSAWTRRLRAPPATASSNSRASRPRLVRFGALKLPARATFAARLREIHQLISQLVEEFSPDAVAVESVFTALNVKTALRLAEMRGVVLLAAAQAQIPAHSYSPREIKASVSGFGGASKQQMQQMVRSLLGASR